MRTSNSPKFYLVADKMAPFFYRLFGFMYWSQLSAFPLLTQMLFFLMMILMWIEIAHSHLQVLLKFKKIFKLISNGHVQIS